MVSLSLIAIGAVMLVNNLVSGRIIVHGAVDGQVHIPGQGTALDFAAIYRDRRFGNAKLFPDRSNNVFFNASMQTHFLEISGHDSPGS